MAELGNFMLVVALFVVLLQIVLPTYGLIIKQRTLQYSSRVLVILQLVFITFAFFLLVYSFLTDNFALKYVADNSNSQLPIMFKFAATWGGHEGSMLLWVYVLSIWSTAVVIFSRSVSLYMLSIIIVVLGFISAVFILFIILTSNPFATLDFVPTEGRDLNPLLQDIGLIIHPPMLYIGYVGMSIPFAFVIAALINNKLDSAWLRKSKPWVLVTFAFLTVGIVLGSWWAYYELGWGGWWFWDPVENASFMPWLSSLALIHLLSVSEKRSTFKQWTVMLAIITFVLSLLGTFLVRSGVLTSVHSFAADPERGLFILVFIVIVIIFSLILYTLKINRFTINKPFSLLSKEMFLLMNNILVVAALIAVLLGTLFPLILDALSLDKISVGEPYFNVVFVAIMLPAVIIMAVSPFIRWKSDDKARIIKNLAPVWIGVILVTIASLLITTNIFVLIAIFIFVWIVMHSIYQLITRLKNFTFSLLGMVVAHIGVAIFILGATVSTQLGIEKDLKMNINDTITIKDTTFTFHGAHKIVGANYSGYRGLVVADNKYEKINLHPEKRQYLSGMPMTEAGIDPTIFRDLFVALGNELENGAWSLRLYYKPLIRLIWLGGLFIMLGAVIAVFDKRYRAHKKIKN